MEPRTWLLELVRRYKPQQGQANVYGVLLYTDRHAFVRKTLTDDYFWSALDEVSGHRWPIFSVRAAPGRDEYPPSRPGTLSFLVPVWKEPSENKQLLEDFELDSTKHLPSLVVFTEAPDGALFKHVVPIDDSSQEACYESLRSVLNEVANALNYMSDQYRREDTRAFDVVSRELHNSREAAFMRKGIRILNRLWEML